METSQEVSEVSEIYSQNFSNFSCKFLKSRNFDRNTSQVSQVKSQVKRVFFAIANEWTAAKATRHCTAAAAAGGRRRAGGGGGAVYARLQFYRMDGNNKRDRPGNDRRPTRQLILLKQLDHPIAQVAG